MNPLKHINVGFWGAIGVAGGLALLSILGYYTKPVRNMLVELWTKKIELELGVLTTIILLSLVTVLIAYLRFRVSCFEAWDRAAISTLSDEEKDLIKRRKSMGMDVFYKSERVRTFKDRKP
jgi:hypothetical protein